MDRRRRPSIVRRWRVRCGAGTSVPADLAGTEVPAPHRSVERREQPPRLYLRLPASMLERTVLVWQTECSRPTSRVTKNRRSRWQRRPAVWLPTKAGTLPRAWDLAAASMARPWRASRAPAGAEDCGVTEIKRASKGPVESGHGALLCCWEPGAGRPAGPNTSSVEERRDRVGHTAIRGAQRTGTATRPR